MRETDKTDFENHLAKHNASHAYTVNGPDRQYIVWKNAQGIIGRITSTPTTTTYSIKEPRP